MRFHLQENRLIPEFLLEKESSSLQRITDFPNLPSIPLNESFIFSTELQSFLSGRSLLLEEIPFDLKLLHEHYLNGYISYQKGIETKCNRCGNDLPHLFASFSCSRCHQRCMYCRNCIMMGRVSECTPLLQWNGPLPRQSAENTFEWTGTLSDAQKEASESGGGFHPISTKFISMGCMRRRENRGAI